MSEVKDEPKQELNPATQFHELYDQEYRSVYRSIRAVVLDAAAAEDLTQETFVRAYRARDRYTPTAPPGAWLRRTDREYHRFTRMRGVDGAGARGLDGAFAQAVIRRSRSRSGSGSSQSPRR